MAPTYGRTIYGQEEYGSGDADTIIRWAIEIDWDNDGSFDGSNEARYCTDLYTQRGRPNFIRSNGEGLQPMRVGKCTIVLDNDDGRYDYFNTSGPLYGNIYPGRLARVRAHYNGTYYPIISGKIADIQPFTVGHNKQVKIKIEDGTRFLKDQKVSMDVQTGALLNTLIGDILDDVGWPSVWGSDLEAYYFHPFYYGFPYWWVTDKEVFQTLHEMSQQTMSTVFVNASGQLTRKNFYDSNPGFVPDVTLDESELGRDISLLQPWEILKNYFKVNYYPIVEQSTAELWQSYDNTLLVPDGESIDIWCELTYDGKKVATTGLTNPVATTDYTANTASDGTGTNKTAYMTVTILFVKGSSAKIRVSNSDSVDFYVTFLRLRGDALSQPDKSSYVVDNTGTSELDGKYEFEIDYQFVTDHDRASYACTWYAAIVAAAEKLPTISLISRPEKQFIELFDSIKLTAATFGISEEPFRVGYVEHRWGDQNGQIVFTKIICEPYLT